MSEEVVPEGSEADGAVPSGAPGFRALSRTARPVAEAMRALTKKDRANLLRAFGKHDLAQAEENRKSASITQIQAEMWSGPLPPPERLAEYDHIQPGLADRLVTMAEKQQDHRQQLENHAIRSQLRQSALGQWFALILGLAAISAAAWLGLSDHVTVACTIAGPTIIALAIAFLKGKESEKKSRDTKRGSMSQQKA